MKAVECLMLNVEKVVPLESVLNVSLSPHPFRIQPAVSYRPIRPRKTDDGANPDMTSSGSPISRASLIDTPLQVRLAIRNLT